LEKHLYPNKNGAITDFFKADSLKGVYITSQLSKDDTVHTQITFDKGGSWSEVKAPENSTCPPTEKVCNLQLANAFSMSKHVHVPSGITSSNSTVGIIMTHGNLGDGLNFREPDVYISRDGGYNWQQPTTLKGSHYLGIGDSGGILWAVPDTPETQSILFSLDEGACWHTYNFTEKPIKVTGLSGEPGSKSTDVNIWGYEIGGSESWQAITIDFSFIMGEACTGSDYEAWQAHESTTDTDHCLLGEHVKILRRKKGTNCVNGANQLHTQTVSSPCECKPTDFLCDYGYIRDSDMKCVKDPSAATSGMDICIDEKEEQIVTKGYRKIPGDKCRGNEEQFQRELEIVAKSCAQAGDYGTDKDEFEDFDKKKDSNNNNNSSTVLIVILVIAVLVLGTSLTVLLYYKKNSLLRIRYRTIHENPLHDDDVGDRQTANGNVLVGTQTLIADDDEAFLIDDPGFLNNGSGNGSIPSNGAILSYHDDSDEDLLVT